MLWSKPKRRQRQQRLRELVNLAQDRCARALSTLEALACGGEYAILLELLHDRASALLRRIEQFAHLCRRHRVPAVGEHQRHCSGVKRREAVGCLGHLGSERIPAVRMLDRITSCDNLSNRACTRPRCGWLALGGSTSTLQRQRTTNLRCRKARSVASHLWNRDHLALLQHLPHELLEAWLRASIVLAMLLIRRCGSLGRQRTRLVGCLAHKECRRWLIQVRRGLDLQAVHMRISISNNITSGARRMARTSRRDRACTPRRP